MKYHRVFIESVAYELPTNIVRTSAIEQQLKPALDRMNMPLGRLEFLIGLKERRFWDDGTKPSQPAVRAAKKALNKAGIKPEELSVVLNASVCRDCLEPSTATIVADKLGVGSHAQIFDVSNACLGFATAMNVLAGMIESGQAKNGLIVSCEAASEVVENSILKLLEKPSEELLLSFLPTFTLGSAAVAMVMSAQDRTQTGLRFCGGSTLNDCRQSGLCHWGPDTGFPATVQHIMKTDGKTLLEAGSHLALKTWLSFEEELGFRKSDFAVSFCHQVGIMHRNVVYSTLGLDINKDFITYDYLGNTGSAALPLTFAVGVEKEVFRPGMKAILLGIGSGLVCTMYALDWQMSSKKCP